MIRPSRLVAAAAVVAGTGIAALVPALPAVAQSSPPVGGIRFQSPAKIADRGAVVFVKMTVVCPYSDTGFVNVTLSDRSGRLIASGQGTANVTCTGTFQTVKVPVPAYNAPFVRGYAFAQGSAYFFDPVAGQISDTASTSLRLH